MHSDDEEFIAYSPEAYRQTNNEPPIVENEDELPYEHTIQKFKWNEFMNEYDSLAASDVSFKRVKRQDEPEEGGGGDDSGGGGGGGGDAGGGTEESGELKLYVTPIIGLTAFFGLVFIVGPLLVRKGPNRGIVKCSIMITAFCMWIFWVTVYIGQMNPLMGPRLENTTVAWLAVKVGNPVKPAAPAGGGE